MPVKVKSKGWQRIRESLTHIARDPSVRKISLGSIERTDVEASKLLDTFRKSPYFATLPKKAQDDIIQEQERKMRQVHALGVFEQEHETHDSEDENLSNQKAKEKENEENRLQ
jgi:hypothetical protein